MTDPFGACGSDVAQHGQRLDAALLRDLVHRAGEGDGCALAALAQSFRDYLLDVATRSLSAESPSVRDRADREPEDGLAVRRGLGDFQEATKSELRAWLWQLLDRSDVSAQRSDVVPNLEAVSRARSDTNARLSTEAAVTCSTGVDDSRLPCSRVLTDSDSVVTELLEELVQVLVPPAEVLSSTPVTVDQLHDAVVQAGLGSSQEVVAILESVRTSHRPLSVEEVACAFVQCGVLSRQQARLLCRGDVRRLRLADFLILDELGRGGMGIVFRAIDCRRNEQVALKILPYVSSTEVMRFKREFRTLANIVHPNLIVLDELHYADGQWFFTMELVEGQRMTAYVLGDRPTAGLTTPDQLQRCRHCLKQLVAALRFLHGIGKLHRDVKPSNVLVRPNGDVTLFDFGMISELGWNRAEEGSHREICGTWTYMAPEQCCGESLSEASDWYSVGVMLFRILAGELPFRGNREQMLAQKQREAPPLPTHALPEGAPPLAELCLQLLRPRPEDRPRGAAIARWLETPAAEPGWHYGEELIVHGAPFVGRKEHLGRLAEAFETVAGGVAACVLVRGESGIGKTSLVEEFLQTIETSRDVVLLRAQCSMREAVPFNALDNIIDGLVEKYRRELGSITSADVHALQRLFPSMRQLGVSRPDRTSPQSLRGDPEVLRRASEALRAWIGKVARRRVTILWIDNLQWGDVDSVSLLEDLLRPPDAPSILLLASLCSGDRDANTCLQRLFQAVGNWSRQLALFDIPLGPLNEQEGSELATLVLQRHVGGRVADPNVIRDVVRESRGHPYLLLELVRHLVGQGTVWGRRDIQGSGLTNLDDVLRARSLSLPGPSRRLLETVVVAGRPLRTRDALAACAQAPDIRSAAMLRAGRLVHLFHTGDGDMIDTYHDRIRASLLHTLSPETRRVTHLRLARTLESSGAEPAVLYPHFAAGGNRAKASHYALLAAAQAKETMAFAQAARLYQAALALGQLSAIDSQQVRRRYAEARAHATAARSRCQRLARYPHAAPGSEGVTHDARSIAQAVQQHGSHDDDTFHHQLIV